MWTCNITNDNDKVLTVANYFKVWQYVGTIMPKNGFIIKETQE